MGYRYTREHEMLGAYHVFNRGLGGQTIFRDDEDRRTFGWMIQRHLSRVPGKDLRGRTYASLRDDVRMVARNVMTTHFHLILWQRVAGGIERLMRRSIAAYFRLQLLSDTVIKY